MMPIVMGSKIKNNGDWLVYAASYLESNVVDVPDTFNGSMFLLLKLTGRLNLIDYYSVSMTETEFFVFYIISMTTFSC